MNSSKENVKALLGLISAYLFLYVFLFGIDRISIWIIRKNFKRKLKKAENQNLDNACKTLGIKRKDLAKIDKKKLKSIFRKLAMKHHPDHGGSKEKFQDVRAAYDFVYAQAA